MVSAIDFVDERSAVVFAELCPYFRNDRGAFVDYLLPTIYQLMRKQRGIIDQD